MHLVIFTEHGVFFMLETFNAVYNLSVNLCVGLVLLIGINLTLDSLDSILNKTFNWKGLRRDIIKGIVVLVCYLATYLVGYLNKDLVDIRLGDGQSLNLMDAVALITITAYYFYAKQVVTKLAGIISSGNKDDKNT